jgi:hypothetical protein
MSDATTGSHAVFTRARNAISFARQVSAEISSVLGQCREICANDFPSQPDRDHGPSRQAEQLGSQELAQDTTATEQPHETASTSVPTHGVSEGVQNKLSRCQVKLTTLKEQHESTLSSLLKLRCASTHCASSKHPRLSLKSLQPYPLWSFTIMRHWLTEIMTPTFPLLGVMLFLLRCTPATVAASKRHNVSMQRSLIESLLRRSGDTSSAAF